MTKEISTLNENELHLLIKECVQEIQHETVGFSLGTAKRRLRDHQQAREKLLSYFASEPFVFTTELEHSNTHIIQYIVQNILAVRNNEILLEGEWFDTDTNERIIKRTKVNCDTKSVMFYSPILRSSHATLNKETRTRGQWDIFMEELTKLRDENRK